MDPLSPNTAAFLNYLSNISGPDDSSATSFPPSAFFPVTGPVPGRDTPEDTPPSAPEADASLSEDSDVGRQGHKRKAHGPKVVDEEADDSSDVGHEDKRAHPEPDARKGRKSDGNKALRRKEQNRAAQKAFRERREAKVKDLEEKVAELEAKSYGANLENENLRGILKRLQEENVALKQSAFTFSMPVSGTATPTIPLPQRQVAKPPSPPQTDDSLRSIDDSPDSLTDPLNMFDTAAIGGHGESKKKPSVSSASASSLSTPSTDQSDINALWASLYPNGVQAGLQPQNNSQNPTQNNSQNPTQNNSALLAQRELLANPGLNPSPYSLLTSQPDFMSFGNAGANLTAPAPAPAADFNRFAFRDTTQPDPPINYADTGMNDFLASLTGNPPAEPEADVDDEFTAQLRQIFGTASPSQALGLAPPTFSPNAYLNMSPSPLTGQSPQSSSASPASSLSSNPTSVSAEPLVDRRQATLEAVEAYKKKVGTDVVHIVDAHGNIIKPSDIWVKFGMQHENTVDHLMIDDLCESMRAKATCVDGQCSIGIDDAERVMKYSKRLGGKAGEK